MGTRCLTVFKESDGAEICVMYRQYDGYPDGHGNDLKELFADKKLVNGISGDKSTMFNGMGCLAASVIAYFKEEAGGFYVHAAGTRDCGEEYIYTLSPDAKDKSQVRLTVQAGSMTFFGMPGTKQDNMPVIWEGLAKDFSAEEADKEHDRQRNAIPNDFIKEQKAKASL